jgi:hypothetical protein
MAGEILRDIDAIPPIGDAESVIQQQRQMYFFLF